jgi:hypothetical protein
MLCPPLPHYHVPSPEEVKKLKVAYSESKQRRMPCLLLRGTRNMSFQATETRKVNKKMNSRECPWPVMISDD